MSSAASAYGITPGLSVVFAYPKHGFSAGTVAGEVRRPTDLAARYGGEEFAVILSDTPEEGAHHVAEEQRKVVEQERRVDSSDSGQRPEAATTESTNPMG